jgi:FkbM family methyltransferase
MDTHVAEVRTAWVSPADGIRFRIAVPESSEPNAMTLGRGEYPVSLRPLFDVLQRVVKPPAKVLDMGGYLGGFGLAAAAAGYDVAIVEPNAENAQWIRQSVSINRFAHDVRVVEAVVGGAEDSVEFCANGPYGHVHSDRSADASTHSVRQVTLPLLLSELSWTAPDFIKMDVEGSEAKVLHTAGSWFACGYRPMLLFEANGFTLDWFGDTPSSLRTLVGSFGYSLYEVDDKGHFRQPSSFEPQCVVDYLATTRALDAVLPARSPWQVIRRTVSALRSPSPQARRYTWKMLRTQWR